MTAGVFPSRYMKRRSRSRHSLCARNALRAVLSTVTFFFILAKLLLVCVAGKIFYNFIAADPVDSPFRLIGVTKDIEIAPS